MRIEVVGLRDEIMLVRYVAIVEQGRDGNYGIWFPDFPGCVASANHFGEVHQAATGALGLHIQGMIAEGATPPKATLASEIKAPEDRLYVFLPVHVEVPEIRDQVDRVNLTMPASLLREIDKVSNNRSGWLADAARERLHRIRERLGSRAWDLDANTRAMVDAGLVEALRQVHDGRPGAMRDVKSLFLMALDHNPELLAILRSYGEDARARI